MLSYIPGWWAYVSTEEEEQQQQRKKKCLTSRPDFARETAFAAPTKESVPSTSRGEVEVTHPRGKEILKYCLSSTHAPEAEPLAAAGESNTHHHGQQRQVHGQGQRLNHGSRV